MALAMRRGYHGWEGHRGVTIIIFFTPCRSICLNVLDIKQNGGNAYGNVGPQSCWKASTARQSGSAFQLKYLGSWYETLDAKRSTSGQPSTWQILWNTCGHSFHSAESLTFLDSQSAIVLRCDGIHSAVIVILCSSRYSHILFVIAIIGRLPVPLILVIYDRALVLSILM